MTLSPPARPPGITYVDGARLRRSLLAACDHARRQRSELNRINVFPVPDGDTGTNLALTVGAIADHIRGNRARSVSAVARETAQAAVLGARGNCGMMLSHFLLGFAERMEGRDRLDASGFADALGAGVRTLYQAVDAPVEGTILSVMRETAEAARDADVPDFAVLIEHLVDRARDALARTPDLLPVLRQAGVVDAGAKGFVHLLEGVLLFIHGDPAVGADAPEAVTDDTSAVGRVAFGAQREEAFRFCTEALVRGPDLPGQGQVRAHLRGSGDSLIVVRAGDVLKVHLHTDDPEAVFGYLRGLGELVTHKAEDMRAQHVAASHVSLARRPVSVITDSACDLPEEVVRAHGIHVTPLVLVEEGGVLRDGVDVSAAQFHRRLREPGAVLPTTSQPAPADFLETYARAAEDGEAVVGVLLSSALSGTFASAEAAARRFEGAPVHLADSLGASLLQGLLVLKAAEMAEMAAPPEQIVAEVERVRKRSGILFTVDVFDRLLASGRVGKGRAWLGGLLKVKPILELTREGRVEPAGKVLGRHRLIAGVMDLLEDRVPRGARVRFGVAWVDVPGIVAPVTAGLRARWGREAEVLSGPATPVIATHLGTGAWAVAYMVED